MPNPDETVVLPLEVIWATVEKYSTPDEWEQSLIATVNMIRN